VKAEIQKVFTEASTILKTAEASSVQAEEVVGKFDETLNDKDLSSAELTEAITAARSSAAEARGQVAASKEKLAQAEGMDIDDDLKHWHGQQVNTEKRRIAQVDSQLDRVDAAVKVGEDKAARKACLELDALKVVTVEALREVMTADSLNGEQLFEKISGSASDDLTSEKFATFARSMPSPKYTDGQAERLFAHVLLDGAETLSKEKFCELIRLFYKVVKSSVLTEEVAIKSKTLRRLDIGEVVEAVEAPKKDADVGVTRLKCKAVNDSIEGYVTIAGNQGTVFLELGGTTYKCIKDTIITDGLNVGESKKVRKIKVDEVVDFWSSQRWTSRAVQSAYESRRRPMAPLVG